MQPRARGPYRAADRRVQDARYVDRQGRECAYYDRFPGGASDPGVAFGERSGTYVVDNTDGNYGFFALRFR